jgi:hypothetical protein
VTSRFHGTGSMAEGPPPEGGVYGGSALWPWRGAQGDDAWQALSHIGSAYSVQLAQFIAVCSSAKPCEIDENLRDYSIFAGFWYGSRVAFIL